MSRICFNFVESGGMAGIFGGCSHPSGSIQGFQGSILIFYQENKTVLHPMVPGWVGTISVMLEKIEILKVILEISTTFDDILGFQFCNGKK